MTMSRPVVLATRGVAGYQQYRIPAMAVTTTGRIIVVYDARPDVDDLPAPIDLVMRTSDDSGETWSPQRVVRAGRGFTGFGDPSLIVDADASRVLLVHQAAELAGFFESAPGSDDDDPEVLHVDVGVSDDDGESWIFRRITGQLKRDGIDALFAASGNGVQLFSGPHAGRLLQPCVVRSGDVISAAVAYSADHGQTWALGEMVGAGTNESKVIALRDGTVLLNSRATPRRKAARSHDGGRTFDRPHPIPELTDPSDNGGAARVDGRPVLSSPAGHQDWLICSHNDDSDLRRNLVVRCSTDNGTTWTGRRVIHSGSAGYSVVARLPNGRIGVCYEREGYAQIVFCSIDLADLANPADEGASANDAIAGARDGALDIGDDGIDLDVVLRFIRPSRIGRIPDGAASHAVRLDEARPWAPAEWREIGQAGTDEAVQMLYTREDLPQLLGPPRPGLAAGDELRFTARIRNGGHQPATGVCLSGTFAGSDASDPVDLPPGQAICYRTIRCFVGPFDVAAGSVTLRFTATATIDGVLRRQSVVRRYSTATGLPARVDQSGMADPECDGAQ